MEWWGYNNEHGWMVLDRSNPLNRPGIKGDLQFIRCRDWKAIDVNRETWNPPLYRYAPNYLADLKGSALVESTAELEAFKADWPEIQRGIKSLVEEAEAKAEAERIAAEKELKKQIKEKKKLAVAAETGAATS